MHIPARIFSVILLFVFFTNLFSPVAFAQSSQSAYPLQIIPPVDNSIPMTVGNISQGVLWGMFSFISCAISGTDVANPRQACLGYNPQTNRLGYVTGQEGLIGMATNGIAMLYSPPQIHVGSFLSYLEGNFGLVKKSYAATSPTGFDQLAPIMKLWLTFRNVTYILFVIVFVIVGFAIMLRAKIDPRTVMTIENQIPKLIVALLLVSFSYAIAGFVIDIMWITTYVIINLFATMDPNIQAGLVTYNVSFSPFAVLNNLTSGGILYLIIQPASSVYDVMASLTKQLMIDLPFLAWPGILSCLVQSIGSIAINPGAAAMSATKAIANSNIQVLSGLAGLISGGTNTGGAAGIDIAKCAGDSAIAASSGIAGGIAFIIFGFALLFALLRMYITLLKSYALFIIYAILGPLFIMLGVLPETKINFDNWIRHLLAYSLVFPYALGIILMSRVVSDVYSQTQTGFAPPLIGVPQNVTGSLGPLIGFAILLLIPQALTMLQDALKAPDMKYLPGVNQMMAMGTSAYTTLVSKPWQFATRREDQLKGQREGILRKAVMNFKLFGKTIRERAGELTPKN